MSIDDLNAAKSKTGTRASRHEDKKFSMPAMVALMIIAITLILFEITDSPNIPQQPVEQQNNAAIEQTHTATTKIMVPISFSDRLNSVTEAIKKVPFKANVTTETGLKGSWTQSGESYRFEDPTKQNIIIFNAIKKKLWVTDVLRKSATETPCDTATAGFYNRISPAIFIEGLAGVSAVETKNLEDILPAGNKATITFTKDGLPDRWDGIRSSGSPCFIDWDYTQLNAVAPTEFELPKDISIYVPDKVKPGAKKR